MKEKIDARTATAAATTSPKSRERTGSERRAAQPALNPERTGSEERGTQAALNPEKTGSEGKAAQAAEGREGRVNQGEEAHEETKRATPKNFYWHCHY